jgi:ribonucleoside-diphosphate reductase alpha chain
MAINDQLLIRYSAREESWHEIANRVSAITTQNHTDMYELIRDCLFLPAGQILRYGGLEDSLLFNSYVLALDENESLPHLATRITELTKLGAGVGINVSEIIAHTQIPLIDVVREIGNSQERLWNSGVRRTATMICVNFSTNGIEEVATILSNESCLRHCNISVNLTDEEMRSLKEQRSLEQVNYFQRIINSVWLCGNPSFVFIDNVNTHNPFYETISACNSCAEQFLMPNEGVPLGSLNLAGFIEGNIFDEKRFTTAVKLATKFLDEVIDLTKFPSAEAETICKQRRRIGLGVFGLDTALRKQGIQYDSAEAVERSKYFSRLLRNVAEVESVVIAHDIGAFADFTLSSLTKPRRNAALLSIAPTGGISSLCGVSSGIEPLFGAHLEKESVSILVDVGNEDMPIKSPFSIASYWHLQHLSAWQENIDGGISKTINLAHSTSRQNISDIIFRAWDCKVKSVALYRNESRPGAIKIL